MFHSRLQNKIGERACVEHREWQTEVAQVLLERVLRDEEGVVDLAVRRVTEL